MFDSLADQIKHDEGTQAKMSQVLLRWTAYVVLSAGLFGVLYLVVRNAV